MFKHDLENQIMNHVETIHRYKVMIRKLCNIIESEYPETDERYQFAMNCLTDVGDDRE